MVANRHLQRGAIAIAFALMTFLLLGVVGLGMDVGRLYIAKTELQNAADACSLAASAALTGANANQLQAAEDLGAAAAARNKVSMQSVAAQFTANSSMTFSDALNGTYRNRTAVPAGDVPSQRFVRCVLSEANIDSILVKVANVLPGSTPITAQSVNAAAIASLVPSISHCAIPLAACTLNSAPPNFGLTSGAWYHGKLAAGNGNNDTQISGTFRWVEFPGATSNTPALRDLLAGAGQCNLNAATGVASKQGQTNVLTQPYNGRFGLYKGNVSNYEGLPDLTGFSFYAPSGAVDGYLPNPASYPSFLTHRASKTAFSFPGNRQGWNAIPSGGPAISHSASGSDRRLVVMPMTNCATLSNASQPIQGWGCFLMLHPVFGPGEDMWLEYRGNAASISSGCVSSGLPGGPAAGGPKVPGLVQ